MGVPKINIKRLSNLQLGHKSDQPTSIENSFHTLSLKVSKSFQVLKNSESARLRETYKNTSVIKNHKYRSFIRVCFRISTWLLLPRYGVLSSEKQKLQVGRI